MQRWRGVEATPRGWGRCVVTIGVFDGVHRGHRSIIGRVVSRARELGMPSVVITFDPHPSEVVRPGSHPAMLTTQRHKAELLEELGVDVMCVLPFTQEFSRLHPDEFVHEVLVEHLHASVVVVGENFRFGHKAAGSIDTLVELGARFGFVVERAPLMAEAVMAELVRSEAAAESSPQAVTTFSSTYVRTCIAGGDVEAAAAALGRPHRVEGIVVRGDGRGRGIGFPTANLETPQHTAIPADGVYAAWLVRGGAALPSAVHVGTNSTFAGTERRVEAFVIGTELDLYGEHVAVDFVSRLRGSVRFDTVEELVAQMHLDVDQARHVLSTHPFG